MNPSETYSAEEYGKWLRKHGEPIKYGLISDLDGRTLEKTIDLVCVSFPDEKIRVTEIGLYNGQTSMGIIEFLNKKWTKFIYTGIDNEKDKPIPDNVPYNISIIGESSEVYYCLQDNSQHLIFVDGCHCFAHVISDFFCYAPKIKVGGFLAFHDTGKHIKPFKDFQHGDKENPDAYISVRKALESIGLIGKGTITDAKTLQVFSLNYRWELIYDEADTSDEAGGICVFKKLY